MYKVHSESAGFDAVIVRLGGHFSSNTRIAETEILAVRFCKVDARAHPLYQFDVALSQVAHPVVPDG